MLPAFCALIPGILRYLLVLVSYVSNVNSFPQPLSSEEEQIYLERLKNGDEEAKNILI